MTKIKYILAVFLFLILVGCVTQPSSFDKEFRKVLDLDKKYNASLYTEALDVENRFSSNRGYHFDWNRTIVDIEKIPLMVEELEKMRNDYYKKEMTEDNKAILLFIKARIEMLESERTYLTGLSIGAKGDTYYGFKCSEKPYILEASHYFNESVRIGQEATDMLDKILTRFPQTRDFLSEDNRPKFYDSPFWPIREYSRSNRMAVEKVCK